MSFRVGPHDTNSATDGWLGIQAFASCRAAAGHARAAAMRLGEEDGALEQETSKRGQWRANDPSGIVTMLAPGG